MKKIMSLDCTLRDGGYCNQWNFRESNIKAIISGLISTGVEIIECGFLTNRVVYDKNISKYTDLLQLNKFISKDNSETKFVVMVNVGEYNATYLPMASETCIDGIRVAFHKSNITEAFKFCEIAKQKGYELFLQPMVTMLYSDEEFETLIEMANKLDPFAFYIVDSFGTMDETVLFHYYNIANKNINKNCAIGFHSHNNLQAAFSNCKALIKKAENRIVIIDSSIYGMGRGAGNLNAELFLNELNINYGGTYDIKPLLRIMDEVISRFYKEKPWGYSLPNYLSAIHMVHPNYAKYLTDKETLLFEDIDTIFRMMPKEKAVEFDATYAEEFYLHYMSRNRKNGERIQELKNQLLGKKILLIAPGASIRNEMCSINEFINNNDVAIISVNHHLESGREDYIFVSNIRRFKKLPETVMDKTIITTNIDSNTIYASVDYKSLINDKDGVQDNAGLMAIKFVIDVLGTTEIYLAGYDGYKADSRDNYESDDLTVFMNEDLIQRMNVGMSCMIQNYREKASIIFLTETLLEKNESQV